MSNTSLPAGWVSTKLGCYLCLKNGFAFKSKTYCEKGNATVPIIRISDIDGKTASDQKASHVPDHERADGFEVNTGDLLIAMSGATTGKVGVYHGNVPAYQNQRVGNLKLLSEKSGSSVFRNYLISSLTTEILKAAYGGAQPNISGKAIEELSIELPPLAEQREIARRLDDLLAQVDSIKTRLDGLPSILKRFRQSTLAAAVSGKLTEEWRGGATFTSSIFSLSDLIGEGLVGLVRSSKQQSDLSLDKTPYLKMNNISNDWGTLIEDMVYVECSDAELLRYALEEGDWLFNTRNSVELVGKSCVWKGPEGYVYNNNILRLRFNKKVLPKYVEIWFRSPLGRKSLNDITSATTSVAAIYQKSLLKQRLELPPIEEQTEIVRRVEELFAFADQVEQRVTDAQAHVNHLTQSILAKAFRGELTADWRAANPDLITGENSAEALLKRIKTERHNLSPKRETRSQQG